MSTGLIIVLVIVVLLGGYLIFSIASYKKVLKQSEEEASENLIHLNDKNFSAVISRGISLVDFWAAWCKPCVFLAPIINQLADEYGDKVNVGKFDVEASKRIPSRLKIMSIPTVIIFKNGKEVQRFVGVKSYNVYKKALEKLLN